MSTTKRGGRRRLSSGTALGAIAVVLASGGVANGGIPARDGTITACMGSANRIHLIDKEAGEECRDFQSEVTWNQEGPEGPEGPQGPAGPEGPPGPPGTPPTILYHIESETFTAVSGTHAPAEVTCPGGLNVVGGGTRLDNPANHTHLVTTVQSGPLFERGWRTVIRHLGPIGADNPIQFEAYAICLSVG